MSQKVRAGYSVILKNTKKKKKHTFSIKKKKDTKI